MYLDATGDPRWNPPFGKSRTRWHVLTGLVLEPEEDMEISRKVGNLLKEYVTEEEHVKWPDKSYKIHYHDIIFGQNVFSHLPHEKRKELSDKIFDTITLAKPLIFATVINKTRLKRIYQNNAQQCTTMHNNAQHPRMLAMTSTIHRFSAYLDRKQHISFAVFDEEDTKTKRCGSWCTT